MSIQTIIFDRDKGGHFLDWSIYFLSGKNSYYSCKHKTNIKLTYNPLNGSNSHNHKGNFARTLSELNNFYKNADVNVLFHQLRNSDLSFNKQDNETEKAIDLASIKSNKIILLKNHHDFVLYDFSFRKRSNNDVSLDGSRELLNNKDILDDFINYFFPESKNIWKKENNLSKPWDVREFVALNFRPFENPSIEKSATIGKNFYVIDTKHYWLDFDIKSLFDYLNLKIDYNRLEQWNSIYRQWQKLHTQRINFCYQFDEIINAIVNNLYINLEDLQLDLLQEASIQHTLIYKYNLNLKNWQLDKFADTKQLHNLLEENFHPLYR